MPSEWGLIVICLLCQVGRRAAGGEDRSGNLSFCHREQATLFFPPTTQISLESPQIARVVPKRGIQSLPSFTPSQLARGCTIFMGLHSSKGSTADMGHTAGMGFQFLHVTPLLAQSTKSSIVLNSWHRAPQLFLQRAPPCGVFLQWAPPVVFSATGAPCDVFLQRATPCVVLFQQATPSDVFFNRQPPVVVFFKKHPPVVF